MDYFNEGEREKQVRFSAARDRFFKPIVSLLASMKITPTQVSIVGIAFAVGAACFPPHLWWATAIFMALYVLMDGIDGPLARHTKTQSQAGSLVDIFADQIGVLIISIAAIEWLDARAYLQVPFSFFYILTVFLMVLSNVLGLKFTSIVRVKYIYFILYIASLLLSENTYIDIFSAIFFCYYLFYFVVIFRKIATKIKNQPL